MTSIKERVQNALSDTENQSANFNKLFLILKKCKNYIEVRDVFFSVKKIEETTRYAFSKEDGEKFWKKYKLLKNKFYPAYLKLQSQSIKEVEDAINQTSSVKELKAIKQAIFHTPELSGKKVTKPLYQACDDKIEQLAA